MKTRSTGSRCRSVALVSLQLQAGLDGFLAVEKHLLHRQGIFATDRRRKPYKWSLDPETAAELDRLMERLNQAVAEECVT